MTKVKDKNKICLCGNVVLCERQFAKPDNTNTNPSGFRFEVMRSNNINAFGENVIVDETCVTEIPEYKILDMHFLTETDREKFKFKIGDIVVAGSTGTPIEIENATDQNNKFLIMFNPDHILCKI